MGSDDNSALESRFRFLRNQLHDLGYKYDFESDSLSLLEALVADLLQTTDTLKHYKELSQGCLQACQELETFVDAYKKDNARLIVELSSLNLSSISDKSAYEKRILDLETQIQTLKAQNVTEGKQNLKNSVIRMKNKENTKTFSCSNPTEKNEYFTKLLVNKDHEIKQLHSEILRLNNLLSGGRPIDVLFKHEQKRKHNLDGCCMPSNTAKLHHLINAFHGEYEAKCNALKLIEHCDTSIEQQHHKLHNEIIDLKNTCKNLENIKTELQTELRSLQQSNASLENSNRKFSQEISELIRLNQEKESVQSERERQLEIAKLKLEKEILELKRTNQEKLADKSNLENQYRKCLDEKKHLSNRVHELTIIEKDLTIEVSRLSNINAIHKRHILELENKLLDVYQSKHKEGMTSKFDLLTTKKPLDKRMPISKKSFDSRISKARLKKPENEETNTTNKVTENKLLPYISEIREKYQKQVDNIQGNDNDLLSFIKRLEDETTLSVESAKAVQRQIETQLESALKQLELIQKQKNDTERELDVIRDKNVFLEDQLEYKESRISHLEQVVANFQKQADNSTTSGARNEEFYRKSAIELERLRNQIKDWEKLKDNLQSDNRKLQNELATLTQDYLACKHESEKAKKDTQDMKIQMHDYIAKVRAAEETLQQKDKERSEMLDHFRTLTIEATQLESNNQSLESEARSTRNALRNAESKIADLEHVIQNKDALISGYEEQLNELTKTIASLETQISNLTAQRDRFKASLDSCEELRSQIDSQRDTLSSTVSSIKSSSKKMEKELLRLQTENQCLQEQIANEKINMATLERLLSETRKNKIEHNLSVSEAQEEIRGLKANIKCLQETLENSSKKLRQSQNEAADYQRQVVQLNRDLTNFQFERIRNSTSDAINYSTL